MYSNIAGIDLGTSNSCVSIYKNGNIEVVAARSGEHVFPSVVSYRDSGITFGKDAKSQISMYPKQTVFEIKRLIGHKFSDKCVQEDIKSWPFEVVPNEDDRPQIKIKYAGEDHYLSPEQVSGFLISKLVEEAERVSGTRITDIVVTVPAYFNDSQRRATADAARAAGVNVLGILNEPTAAAIAYGVRNEEKDKTILVYDLGGGTFDVTILDIRENEYNVVATDGDTHLGGVDLDQILEKMIYDIASPSCDPEIEWETQKSRAILRRTAEDVKIQLSTTDSVEFTIFDETFIIYRTEFERNASQFFAKTMTIVDQILANTGKRYEDIDDVVLVGGSSRIPYIKTMLGAKFGEEKVSYRINPDEAVSMGALTRAIQLYRQNNSNIDTPVEGGDDESGMNLVAAPHPGDGGDGNDAYDLGDDDDDFGFDSLDINDVVPLSLGLKNSQGVMSVLIPRFSHFGESFTRSFVTNKNNQESMKVRVYQGERPMAEDNLEIGSFRLRGIPPMPRGQACVDITFTTDHDGILTVSAVVCQVDEYGEILTGPDGKHLTIPGTELRTTFENKSTNLNEYEVEKIMKQVQEMKEYDAKKRRIAEQKNKIQERSFVLEEIVMKNGGSIDPENLEKVNTLLRDVKRLMRNNTIEEDELQSYFDLIGQWIESLDGN